MFETLLVDLYNILILVVLRDLRRMFQNVSFNQIERMYQFQLLKKAKCLRNRSTLS